MSEEQGVAGVGFLVAAFTDENAAEAALKQMKQARKQGQFFFDDAVVIRQDADGGVHYHETGDMTSGKGAGYGALVGGVIGILGGPIGIAIGAGAGALLGGAAAHGDAGFADESIKQLGVAIQPGTSALMATTSQAFVEAVRKQNVADDDVRAALAELYGEIASKLSEGKDVAVGILLTEEGLAVREIAADDKSLEVMGFVATEDAVVAGHVVATEEGVAYEVAAATEEGVVYEAAVATEEGAALVDVVATDEGAAVAAVVATPEPEDVVEDADAEEVADAEEAADAEETAGSEEPKDSA